MPLADPPSMIVGTWLQTQGHVTLGADAFIAMLPASEHDGPVNALMINDTAGIRDGRGGTAAAHVDVQHHGVQLLNRDTSYPENWEFVSALREGFNSIENATVTVGVNQYTIRTAIVVSGPVNVGFDDTTNASLLSLNLLLTIGSN